MSSYGQRNPRNSTNSLSPVSSPRKRAQQDADFDASENRRKDPKVSRACDLCKIKKIRCTGTLPCANCTRRRLYCAYATKYSRGRAPTPLPMERQEGPSVVGRASIASHSGARIEDSNSGMVDGSDLNKMGTGPPSFSNETAPSRDSPELEIEGQYFDPTSGLTFLHRAWRKFLVQKVETESHGSSEMDKSQLLTCAGDRPFYLGDHSQELIPDDMTARTLVSFYFDTCVVTYRMFHRQTVENWLEVLLKDREHNRPISQSLGNAKCAIILTLFAIARFRNEKLKGGYYSSDNEALALRENDRLFCAAMNLTDSEKGFPRLESVQARLIQVLYLLQTSRMNKAWYTFGSAYQILSSLGLHRRRSQEQGVPFKNHSRDYISLQCSKRVFWVAYTIDGYLSVVFGRPRFLHDEDVDQDFPDSINDEDMGPHGPLGSEASEDCHVDSLTFHAKIARIIGRISRAVYAVGDVQTGERVAAANRLIGELHEWRASLPPHLGTIKPSTLMPSFRRESCALNLAYYHAVIHANRPFLLGEGNGPSCDSPDVNDLVAECISAARVILELVDNMANDINLFHSFWWTHYVTFCALAVVYVWEIQRSQNKNKYERHSDESFHAGLFDLAERCRSHLLRASSAASPSRRYGIILEELRKEAQGQTVRNNRSDCPLPSPNPTLMQNTETPLIDQGLNFLEIPETSSQYIAHASARGDFPNAVPSMLNTWQPTDWLDLDSSAFYPFFDIYDETSSPWSSTIT